MQDVAPADQRVEILERLGVDVTQVDLADEEAAIDALWDGTMRLIAGQLRFMGRLAGIDDTGSFNEDAPEVQEARQKVVEAFREFFVLDARQALQEAEDQANAQRAALLRQYPGAEYHIDRIYPTSVTYGGNTPPQVASGYGSFTQAGQGAGVDYVGGLGNSTVEMLGLWDGTGGYDGFRAAEAQKGQFLSDLGALAETIRQRELLDEAAFQQQIANIIDLFVSAWEELKQIYYGVVALIEQGQLLFATHYVASLGAQALPSAILTFVAVAIANAAGGAVVLGVSRAVFQAAVRVGVTIAPSARQLRNTAASAAISVTLTRMRPSVIGDGFEPGNSLGALRTIDTDNLPPNERRLVDTTEGSVGTYREGDDPLDESPAIAGSRDRREDVREDGSYRNPGRPGGRPPGG